MSAFLLSESRTSFIITLASIVILYGLAGEKRDWFSFCLSNKIDYICGFCNTDMSSYRPLIDDISKKQFLISASCKKGRWASSIPSKEVKENIKAATSLVLA